MKKVFSLLLVTILLLAGCGSSESAGGDGVKKITIASVQSDGHPQIEALKYFKEEFEAKTDGRYEVDIQGDELLGSDKETLSMVKAGTLDMAIVAATQMESYDPAYAAVSLPYEYDSLDHYKAVVDSGVLEPLFEKSATELGIRPIATFTAGARSLYLKTPYDESKGLEGLKIRVMDSQSQIDMMTAMGGSPTPMSMGDVYTSLQQGVIDGAENNEVSYADSKHCEVAPYYYYTQHLMVPDYLVASTTLLDSMSEEDKAIFDEVILDMQAKEFELWDTSVEENIQLAKDSGAEFNDIDKKPFQDALAPLNDKATESNEDAKKVYDAIKNTSY